MCNLHHLSSSSTSSSSSSPFCPPPFPCKQQTSPTQIQKFLSCSYIMADLRVEAKSFVTSLPPFLSKDFTNICKMSAVWVRDNSSGNLLPFTAHVDQHCLLYLNPGGLLCGYLNTIRYCFHITNVRLVIDTHRFVIIWTFLVNCLRAGWSRDRIPVGTRFSAPVQTDPEAHPACCTMGTGSIPGVRCSRGVTLTPHPFLVQRSKIE